MKLKSVTTFTLACLMTACASDQSSVNDEEYKRPNKTYAVEEVIVTGAKSEGRFAEADVSLERSVLSTEIAYIKTGPVAPVHDFIKQKRHLNSAFPVGYEQNTESYIDRVENRIHQVISDPVSTFSIDVDTASYSNIRRMLNANGYLPPADAVKLEEMVNYFSYQYPTPESSDQPFSISTELAPAPWDENKMLLQIGLKGYEPPLAERPAANLVFLVDVSGSMQSHNKLPLLKKSLRLLVNQMTKEDRIALVSYAGAAGLVLESTAGSEKAKILSAIDNLEAGGSTHGSAGIKLAYQVAEQHHIEDGINRILIASDGDMNVGVTSVDELKDLIKEKRKGGIALTTLGFGHGNYNDGIMEQLADVGNGNAAYIDGLKEAQKVLVNEMQSTLMTIAKDVKIQVEFNPAQVSEYRLLGYENRMLNREDFQIGRAHV